MTEIPIIVSTNEVTVGGMVDKIDLQVGVGQQGPRGSRIFSGDVSPLTLPINSPFFAGYTEFIYGDMYIQRSASNIAVWEWKNQPGGDTWVKTSDIAVAGGGGITSLDPDLTAIADLTGTSGLLRKSGINTWVLDTNTYLTSNQTVTLTGDATGSGSTSIPVTVVDDSHSHTGSTISALDAGDTTTGTFNIARIPTGTTGTTVALGNHTHSYQPLDADLTAIAAVSGTGYLRRTGVDTWVLDTPATATWGSISGTLSSQTDLQSALNGKQAADNDLTAIAALAGTSGFLKKTATDTWALDTNTYLTGNQSISVSGDATGSGTTSIALTLANSGVTAGTYNNVASEVRPFTVDVKGRVTGVGSAVSIVVPQSQVTNLVSDLSLKAPLVSPALTGTPTSPTAAVDTNTTQLATTAFVVNQGYLKSATASLAYQPLDGDLTAIGGIAATTGLLRKTAANTWSLDTNAYLTGNQSISLSGAVSGSGTTSISTSFSTNTVFPESISARNYVLSTDGIPTTNLGNPTVPEMAIFDSQFNNKLWFYDPTKLTFEYTMDGTNWVTQANSTTEVKRLLGGAGATASSIFIPNLAQKYRIDIRNDGNYVFLNALYAYYSTNSHQTKVHIWVKRDDGSWIQYTSSTRNMSSWPGHLYMPFNTIPWSLSLTPGHYNDVRIEFTPVWTTGGGYDNQHIYLMNLEMWGGYPSGRRTIFNWDEDRNVTFPAQVTASSFSGSGAGLSSISQSAVTNLVSDLSAKAPLASPIFTGTPSAPTAAVDTNTTQLATTAYVIGQGYLKSAAASSTYQPLDADLTSIAGLAGATGLLRKTALNTWSLDTNTYITGNQTITLSGDASGSGTTAITVVVADDSHNHTTATISALDTSDVTTGTFDIARIPTGTTGTTVALGNHTHAYQPVDADLTAIAALAGTSGFLKKTAADTWSLDTSTYLTGNQTITLSGDATGSGTTAITVAVVDDSHSHTSSTISALDAADTTTGIFDIARIPTGSTGTTVSLGNHTHSYLSSSTSSTQAGYFGDIYLYDDSTPSHYLQITNSANLTLARILSINVNDADRTVSLSGNLTVPSAATVSGTNTGDQTITLTGDVTGTGTGSFATTLATVNSNVGSYGSASSVATFTVNAKGLTTAAGNASIQIAESQVTNLVTDLSNKQPLDADLTAIAALAGTSGLLKKTAADTWTLDTTAYTTNLGTVTSVGMTVPTGLSISGSPVTTSGTLAVTLTAGYAIPTTASQANWDTAYTDRNKWDGGSSGLVASTGRSSLGGTTVGSNLFTLTNPTAVTFLRINADNTVSTLDAATFRSAIGAGTSSTTGTVTSVAMTVPTGLSISGSPISTSGTLALTLTSGYEIPTTAALAAKAPLAGPTFTGTPSAPTAAVDTSTTQLATTAYVINQGYLKSSTASSTYLPLSGGTLTGGNVVDTVLTIKNGASTNTELRLEHPYGMNASTLGFGDNTKREANISLYNTGLNFALTMDGSTITSSLIMYDGAAIVGGSAGSTPIGLSASTLHLWANQINATANMALKRDWPSFVLAGTKAGSVVKNGSIYFQAGDGNQRWIVGASDDAESGSNAGSNLFIRRYSDANANLGDVLTINRATGLVEFSGAVSGLVPTSVDNTVPRFDGTTGKLQTSGVTITDDGAIQVFNATSDFHFSSAAANSANFYISNVSAGQNAAMFFRVNGYKRWFVGKEASAESGSNTGSNFRIWRYNDDGTSIGQAFGINRATGLVTIDASGSGAGIELGVSGPRMMTGSGNPEAVVSAPVGSEWTETSTGITYDKMSGTGNTGWVARQFGAGYIEDTQAMMMMGVL